MFVTYWTICSCSVINWLSMSCWQWFSDHNCGSIAKPLGFSVLGNKKKYSHSLAKVLIMLCFSFKFILLKFHCFFSVNLMASLGTLAAIAKQRPAFMSLVVEAFESLHGKVSFHLSLSMEVSNETSFLWYTVFHIVRYHGVCKSRKQMLIKLKT